MNPTYERRKAAGLCLHCGNCPPRSNRTTCAACAAIQAKKHQDILDRGLCGACAKAPPAPGRRTCEDCTKKNRARKATWPRQGRCVTCGSNPPAESMRQCSSCIARQRAYNASLKRQVYEAYGNKCACCGEATSEFLSIDHINNDGKQHRQEVGTAAHSLHLDLLRRGCPKDFCQPLCGNCHFAKTHSGVCPHQLKKPQQPTDDSWLLAALCQLG